MRTKIEAINRFLKEKEIAVIGASRNQRKFGYLAFNILKKNNYIAYPVNPNITVLDENTCYPDVKSLPDSITAAFIITPKIQTAQAVRDVIEKGIKHIWIQKTAETKEAIDIAESNNINLVKYECIFMFIEPRKVPHNVHRFINKTIRKFPT